jgi:hypothetical protein
MKSKPKAVAGLQIGEEIGGVKSNTEYTAQVRTLVLKLPCGKCLTSNMAKDIAQ